MKRKLKQILVVIIVVIITLSAMPMGGFIGLDLGFVSSAAGITVIDKGNCGKLLYYDDEKPTFGSNAKFTLYSDGKLVISGKGEFGGFEHPDNKWVHVPYAHYELIDSQDDYYADITVKSVVIEKGITSIGQCAFRNFLALESIVIPSGVTSIDYKSFWGCENLKSISIPEGVTSIGDGAFFWCSSLNEIILPKSVNEIRFGVFWGCKSLTHFTIPDGITSISASSFYDCSNLTKITIPASVKAIKSNAFYACTSLEDIYYIGTEQQLKSIVVDSKGNACIDYAIVHYNHKHNYKSKVMKVPTCCTKGECEMICVCGEHYSKILPTTGEYSPKTRLTKATTSADGKIVTYCNNCQKVRTTVTIPKVSKIELSSMEYPYDGNVKTPTVTVKDSKGKTLKNGTDYTVSYASGRKSVGQYAVKITLKGNYSGSKTLTFNIVPPATSKIAVAQSASAIKAAWKAVSGATGYKVYLYNGSKLVKSVVTTNTNYTFTSLSSGTAYKVYVKAYKTVNGKNFWSASKSLSTSTRPGTPALSAAAGTKKATLKWNKQTGATGYVVYMATSKTGKYSKIATLKGNTAVSYTKTGLTKGKTYYFKVAAYKTVGSSNLYGSFSSVKAVKVK